MKANAADCWYADPDRQMPPVFDAQKAKLTLKFEPSYSPAPFPSEVPAVRHLWCALIGASGSADFGPVFKRPA